MLCSSLFHCLLMTQLPFLVVVYRRTRHGFIVHFLASFHILPMWETAQEGLRKSFAVQEITVIPCKRLQTLILSGSIDYFFSLSQKLRIARRFSGFFTLCKADDVFCTLSGCKKFQTLFCVFPSVASLVSQRRFFCLLWDTICELLERKYTDAQSLWVCLCWWIPIDILILFTIGHCIKTQSVSSLNLMTCAISRLLRSIRLARRGYCIGRLPLPRFLSGQSSVWNWETNWLFRLWIGCFYAILIYPTHA